MSIAVVNIAISAQSFSLATAQSELQRPAEAGGQCAFEGIIRNHNHGLSVNRLEYECYETLALKEFNRIANEAVERFHLTEVLLRHRVGSLEIGETAVVVITLAHHRNEAFLGTRYIIDQLKVRAPIWKKEFYADGSYEWPRCNEHQH
jgi:molybdopterin synthase catalytic subunit